MASFSRTSAVLFLAAASVYPGHVGTAIGQTARGSAAKSATTDVRLLEDTNADPFAVTPAALAGAPATSQPSDPSRAEMKASLTGSSINLQDTNIIAALNMLAAQNGRNIVAGRDVKGTVTLSLNDVSLDEALDAICKQNDLVKVDDGPVIYVYSRKEYSESQKANRRTATQVFTLHYVPVGDAEKMVKNLLSPEGKTVITTAAKTGVGFDNASSGGDDSAGSSLLVVTDYDENLNNVTKLIQEIDVRPLQVLVEATILRASLQEDNALGVDFTVLGGVDFSTIGTNNGQFVNANSANPITANGDRLSSVGTGNSFSNSIPSGLKLGFVSSNVSVFLSALEETTDTAVLANPKVLTLNKQKGEVKVVRKDPYRGAIVVDVNGQSRQEIEEQETGTKLVFRPFIGNDGFIRLEIHPEDSTALAARAADLPPSSLSTEATTNVLVKDGRTIVIGGLFRESTATSRSQIPVLGSIPVLGNLFRKKADNTVREEIIILLTPHIVKDDEAYAKLSEKEARDADRIRVGVRRGMMPWGRERLAESAYENAVKEMAKDKPNKRLALWHLDIATNLNPKFLEAIDLKEKISGRVVTSVDNSSIRSFVRDAVLNETGLTASATSARPIVRIGGGNRDANGPLRLTTPQDDLVPAVDATTQPTTAPAPLTAEAVEPATVEPVTVDPATTPESTTAVVEVPVSSAVPVDPTPSVDTLPPASVTVTEMAGTTDTTTDATTEVTTTTVSNPALADVPLPRVLTADEITTTATATTQPVEGVTSEPAFQITELPTGEVDGAGQK
jgi:type IV pilus assembly protein PilQ